VFFEGILLLRYLQQSEKMQASGPQLEQMKGCLVGGLRSPSSSSILVDV